jgi:hypothetical protein
LKDGQTKLVHDFEIKTALDGVERIKASSSGTSCVSPASRPQAIVHLYTGWHAARTGTGYDAKAAEWKAKLAAM